MSQENIKHWCIDALGPLDRQSLLKAKEDFAEKIKTNPYRAEYYRHVLAYIKRKLKQ